MRRAVFVVQGRHAALRFRRSPPRSAMVSFLSALVPIFLCYLWQLLSHCLLPPNGGIMNVGGLVQDPLCRLSRCQLAGQPQRAALGVFQTEALRPGRRRALQLNLYGLAENRNLNCLHCLTPFACSCPHRTMAARPQQYAFLRTFGSFVPTSTCKYDPAQKERDFMSIPEVISSIIAQKNSLGMTNQQIADTAKVSKATVDRLLRGDPAAGPSAQTLFDIAAAVGCRCDIAPPPDADNGKDDSSEAAPNTAGLSTAPDLRPIRCPAGPPLRPVRRPAGPALRPVQPHACRAAPLATLHRHADPCFIFHPHRYAGLRCRQPKHWLAPVAPYPSAPAGVFCPQKGGRPAPACRPVSRGTPYGLYQMHPPPACRCRLLSLLRQEASPRAPQGPQAPQRHRHGL